MTVAQPTVPNLQSYCVDRNLAGPFENLMLYSMCRGFPGHKDAYVTAGKIISIGRIYSASPSRGAGYGKSDATVFEAIGERLADTSLDEKVRAIKFSARFSASLLETVVTLHEWLVAEIVAVTRNWSSSDQDKGWNPRNQASFASNTNLRIV